MRDILIYACRTAARPQGRRLVRTLAEFTGADVAAATKALGGMENNWILDWQTGSIGAEPLVIEGYEYYLADQEVWLTTDDKPYFGGEQGDLRYAIIHVGDGENITFNIDGSDTVTISAELSIPIPYKSAWCEEHDHRRHKRCYRQPRHRTGDCARREQIRGCSILMLPVKRLPLTT